MAREWKPTKDAPIWPLHHPWTAKCLIHVEAAAVLDRLRPRALSPKPLTVLEA